MIQTLKFESEEARVLVGEMSTIAELRAALANFPVYADEYAQITTEKRQKEFLSTRLLINELQGHPVEVTYDANGKPFLRNSDEKISFTHSGKWVAVIVHPEKSVGIDLECPSSRILKVAQRFTGEKEREYFRIPENERELLLIWCAKEAIYKMKGSEVTDFALTMEVLPFRAEAAGEFVLRLLTDGKECLIQYKLNDDYALTWSVDKE